MKPVIGIPLRSALNFQNASMEYLFEKVRLPFKNLGAIILPIPYVQPKDIWNTKGSELAFVTEEEKEEIRFFLNQCDGLFLAGGDKFIEQDRILYEMAVQRKMPVFATCLGMQAIATIGNEVKLQEIKSSIRHQRRKDCRYAHTVKIRKDSLLYEIVGKEVIQVNSFHKKCVYSSPKFIVTARASDGVIEAIEPKEDHFCIAVQWHPELMPYDEDANKLLSAFYEQTKQYHLQKEKQKSLGDKNGLSNTCQ